MAVSITDILASSAHLKAVKALRALRALRPLRAISRYPGLRVVVTALFGAMPQVLNISILGFLIFLVFAVVCVNFLKGAMSSCQGPLWNNFNPDQVGVCHSAPVGIVWVDGDVWIACVCCDDRSTWSRTPSHSTSA